MKIQLMLGELALFLVLICGYLFLFHRGNNLMAPDTTVTQSSGESILSTEAIAGEYDAAYGVGILHVTFRDTTHIVISGQTILPGAGNSTDAQTIRANTGTMNETVAIQNNKGIIHPDASEAGCTLVITFSSGSLQINGGDDSCDATIANFDGTYIKMTYP